MRRPLVTPGRLIRTRPFTDRARHVRGAAGRVACCALLRLAVAAPPVAGGVMAATPVADAVGARAGGGSSAATPVAALDGFGLGHGLAHWRNACTT